MTGFANAQGGIIVLGVNDKNKKLQGIPNADLISDETIHRIINSGVTPFIENIDIRQIRLESVLPGYSVMVIHVPMSYDGPHMFRQENRYYRRIGTENLPMDHQMIIDVFNRARRPELRVDLRVKSYPTEFILYPTIHNDGKITAHHVFCKFAYIGQGQKSHISSWENTNYGHGFGSDKNVILYPGLPLSTGSIRFKTDQEQSSPHYFKFNLYADNFPNKEVLFKLEDGHCEEISPLPSKVEENWQP